MREFEEIKETGFNNSLFFTLLITSIGFAIAQRKKMIIGERGKEVKKKKKNGHFIYLDSYYYQLYRVSC